MSIIEITDAGFTINGTSSQTVAKSLIDAGLSNQAIAEVIGGWFVGVTGATTPAPFRFTTDVQMHDPNCGVDYARGFTHVDWIDGESRVQAGMTPEELGVNSRFHAIENEFDAIADQFRRLGACVAELRADLVGVTGELEAKLTALQNEVHALQQDTGDSGGPLILGTTKFAGKDAFVTKFGDDFRFVEMASEPIKTYPPSRSKPLFDPEVLDESRLSDLVLDLDDVMRRHEVEVLFERGGPVTVVELRRAGSDIVLGSGTSLGAVLADLPADAAFATTEEAVAEIVTALAGALPDERVREVRASTLSEAAVERTGGALLNSGVSAVVTDATVAGALEGAGITTVGRLASGNREEIRSVLAGAGVDPALADRSFARAVLGRALRNRIG